MLASRCMPAGFPQVFLCFVQPACLVAAGCFILWVMPLGCSFLNKRACLDGGCRLSSSLPALPFCSLLQCRTEQQMIGCAFIRTTAKKKVCVTTRSVQPKRVILDHAALHLLLAESPHALNTTWLKCGCVIGLIPYPLQICFSYLWNLIVDLLCLVSIFQQIFLL